MEFEVTKDKNLISFLGEGKNKPYVFDINTGVLYSLRSQPLRNMPSTLQGYLNRHNENNPILFLMSRMIDHVYSFSGTHSFHCDVYTNNVNLFLIADKLNSIGYTITSADYCNFYPSTLEVIGENFKEFAKYFAENEDVTIGSFINNEMPSIWARNHNIEVNEIFTIRFINNLMSSNYSTEQLNYLIHAICRGVVYYYTDNRGEIDHWSLLRDFDEYFRLCEVLEIKYEKDFFRGVINAKRMYITYRKEFDAKALKKNYEKHNFNFESEDFVIVIPQTAEDFKDEATQQNNCVYSCYLEEVINGKTSVVFIRKKDNPQKSFITCEVNNRGQIRQYLYRFNNNVRDKSTKEYQFKIDFQNWLNENWE